MSIKSHTQQVRDRDCVMEYQMYIYVQQQQQRKRLEELTMRPVISTVGTATYKIAKCLNKLVTA